MKPGITALSYAAARAAWCRREMLAFLRRWAAYAAVIVMLIGAGTVGAPDVVTGVCALLVLPLAAAIENPAWLAPAMLAHAAAGGMLLAGARRCCGLARGATPKPRCRSCPHPASVQT
jgi:hypothetical protein